MINPYKFYQDKVVGRGATDKIILKRVLPNMMRLQPGVIWLRAGTSEDDDNERFDSLKKRGIS